MIQTDPEYDAYYESDDVLQEWGYCSVHCFYNNITTFSGYLFSTYLKYILIEIQNIHYLKHDEKLKSREMNDR